MLSSGSTKLIVLLFFLFAPFVIAEEEGTLKDGEIVLPEVSEPIAAKEGIDKVNLRYLTTRDGTSYIIADGPTSNEQQEMYDRLSPEGRERFQKIRIHFLRVLLGSLHRTRWVPGAVRMAKEKFKRVVRPKVEDLEPLPSFKQLTRSGVQSLLVAANEGLWNRCQVVSDSHEFGVYLGAGLSGGAGMGKRGFYGGGGVGLLGLYNVETQGIKFELTSDYERTNQIVGGLIGVYPSLNVGFVFSASKLEPGKGFSETRSIYTPLPLYSVDHTDRFYIRKGFGIPLVPAFFGLNLGWASWIPLPTTLGAAALIQATGRELRLLNVEASVKGPRFRLGGITGNTVHQLLTTGATFCHKMYKKITSNLY